jgi:hypothetical protein
MIIREFLEKYSIAPAQADGFRNAAKFWARNDFDERLLVMIYIREFGVYPGGVDTPLPDYIEISVQDMINLFYNDLLDMGTWQ